MAKKRRSIVKAISWRLIASLTLIIIALVCTNDLSIAGKIGGLDFTLKFALYYFHERAWNEIDWGEAT